MYLWRRNVKQKLTPEYVDHPSPEAEDIYRAAIKLLARALVQTALTQAHRELRVSKPLPFTTAMSDSSGGPLDEHSAAAGRLS